jgi:hypothetical protein
MDPEQPRNCDNPGTGREEQHNPEQDRNDAPRISSHSPLCRINVIPAAIGSGAEWPCRRGAHPGSR